MHRIVKSRRDARAAEGARLEIVWSDKIGTEGSATPPEAGPPFPPEADPPWAEAEKPARVVV